MGCGQNCVAIGSASSYSRGADLGASSTSQLFCSMWHGICCTLTLSTTVQSICAGDCVHSDKHVAEAYQPSKILLGIIEMMTCARLLQMSTDCSRPLHTACHRLHPDQEPKALQVCCRHHQPHGIAYQLTFCSCF